MKVVHVTTSSRGGAGIAALRLHKALQKQGVASAYVSKDLTVDFEGNEVLSSFFSYRKPTFFQKLGQKLYRIFFPTRAQKLQKQLTKHKESLNYEMLSVPFSNIKLASHPLLKEATIIHLHWVGLILDYPSFFSRVSKPIVWTLHDANPFMGLFHYKNDRQRNQAVKTIDDAVQALKKNAVAYSNKLAIVSPSQWLLDDAHTSGFYSPRVSLNKVANSIDKTNVSGNNDSLKTTLGIDTNERVLLVSAVSLDNYRKGIDLFQEALRIISFPLTILTLGKGQLTTLNNQVKVIPLGYVDDAIKIQKYYAIADGFVLPSREDNLPNTMLESLSAGTPVIGFAIGGLKEHIKEGVTGVLANTINAASLAEAITTFYKSIDTYNSKTIKAYAEANFAPENQAKKYLDIYTNL
ncbi:glycosyltransferase [Patiriisocius hiemis]|uniref:Glycosyltransferase n=1 Tax=Patiriisocius hiemis TaxID=3075604 RepID=A0ABU2YEG1_9FLAO|nr:glycosyltransferase [Constantimarinum sp. W242]MDT0556034.1 glycosyltransferase [Constantimarinum sp. W242]